LCEKRGFQGHSQRSKMSIRTGSSTKHTYEQIHNENYE
jgi:hypothetical protein